MEKGWSLREALALMQGLLKIDPGSLHGVSSAEVNLFLEGFSRKRLRSLNTHIYIVFQANR